MMKIFGACMDFDFIVLNYSNISLVMDEYEKHLTLLWVASRASWGKFLDVDR